MTYSLGRDARFYRNTGTWASPTWSDINNVRDLTLNLESDEIDVTTRGTAVNGFKAVVSGLSSGGIEFDMVWDPTDAAFTAIKDAWLNKTTIELAAMSGDIATSGSQGLHADFAVLNFSRGEPLEGVQTVTVSVKPSYSDNAAEWLVI